MKLITSFALVTLWAALPATAREPAMLGAVPDPTFDALGSTMMTAPSLVETCENGGADNSEICAFYIAGVLDHSKQFGNGRFDVCAPSDATNDTLRHAFLEEIERTGRFIPDDMAAAPYVVSMFVHRGWTC